MLIKNYDIGDIINTNTGQIQIISLEGTVLFRAPTGENNEVQLYSIRYNNEIYYVSDIGLQSKDMSIFDKCIANIGYRGYISFKQFPKEYNIWKNMLYRCYWKNSNIYPYYGGIGITVDPRWFSFEIFLYDLFEVTNYDKFITGKTNYELDLSIKQKNIPINNRVYSRSKVTLRPFYMTDVYAALNESKSKGNAPTASIPKENTMQIQEEIKPVFNTGINGPSIEAYKWIIDHPPTLKIPSFSEPLNSNISILNGMKIYKDKLIKSSGGDKQ